MDFPKVTNFSLQKKLVQSICYTSYEAIDKAKDEPCVLKILNKNVTENETLAQEFLSHAQILTGLKNEHICQVNGCHFDTETGNHYLISQKNDLQPLSAIILDKFSLSLEDLLDIFTQICATLRYTNLFGVLHGMLNPNSIFINSEGKIKIDDFGFNWYIPTILKKKTKESLFLAQYIAPDYYQDIKTVDGRSDIYSIGLLLYEVVSGKAPVSGKSMDAVNSSQLSVKLPAIDFNELGLPIELAAIISKATNKNKGQRYQNFKHIIDDLKKIRYKYVASSQHVAPPSYREEPSIIDEEHPPEYKSIFPDFLSKKVIFSGVGAVLFVFLILFVTNYIPFGHKEQNSNNNEELSSVTNGESAPMVDASLLQEKIKYNEPAAIKTPVLDVMDEAPPARLSQEKIADTIENTAQPILDPLPQLIEATVYVISKNLPVRADIFVENKYMGKTDKRGRIKIQDLVPGSYLNLKVIKDGYKSAEKTLGVDANTQTFTIDLKQIPQNIGTVVFDAIPGADKIFIDGVLQDGSTPRTITLQSGKHKIAMVNSALGLRHDQTIDLRNKQTLRIKHDFTIKLTGSIAVSLTNAAEFGYAYVYIDEKPWKGSSKTTPLEVQLPVGVHKIAVKRDGFICSPAEQVINIESKKIKFVSFTLNRIGTN